MSFVIDESMHWTDHYAKWGFALVRNVVDQAFIDAALAEVRQLPGGEKPLTEWRSTDGVNGHFPYTGKNHTVLATVYDQPGVRKVIDEMFGSPDVWNGERAFQLFVNAFNPEAPASLSPRGHIDFVNCPIPLLGSGFMFQLSLVKTEPFSGNITIYPGTHKQVQKLILDDPNWRFPANQDMVEVSDVYEFVAEPGDMFLFSHLIFHAGNYNHAAGKSPRCCIHAQGLAKEWLSSIDPNEPNISPWKRSLAVNGAFNTRCDEEQMMKNHHKERAAATARGEKVASGY